MDYSRDLRPWEYEHTKRIHVYKIPAATFPSASSEDFGDLSDTGSKDVIAKILAKMYYQVTAAHNDRQFERSQEPWCFALPSFTFETAYGGEQVVGLDAYLELGKKLFGDPKLKVEVLDVSIQIDPIAGMAEVFANQALVSPKLTRRSVCVVEFRRVEGQWLMACGKNIKGDDNI
ncbi:hypothetical protein M409DRAFT_18444 [Zasmidium cellare ATCC 36951]|uniref:SnoaL-like domain-containing protein n=1 Tax=Zasmidium cellare ATCC 36951 TaxID=1080233 RepID=A0A6A6CZT7_ZASCE|nr:uncharacterized protein M409DRAFT_18444 [Zasmidium cellare ATCC 36951]KAF2171329.1 hypothetical protein M409DRAFT_18444 [Zasmidium cellare ATCC 36951]